MFDHVDHIAIAVEDIDRSIALYVTTFGQAPSHRERVEDFKVEIATVNIGETAIEFIQPTSGDSPIRKFLDERGQGIHHIAFRVDDICAALKELEAKGAEVIDKSPRKGKDGSLVAFIHPRSTERVLYELVQVKG
ncbi:MAG: methylmalonyl-CoA epimerase [bacterium]|nr:methylmalonyl-CoA epimerase [bacterium]